MSEGNKPANVEKLAYRIDEFCHAMGVSRAKAYALMKEGHLPYFYIGTRRHIPADAAKALVATATTQAQP